MCCRLLVPSFYRAHTTVTFSTLITESDVMEEHHLITVPTVFFLAFPQHRIYFLLITVYPQLRVVSTFHIPCKFILFIISQSIKDFSHIWSFNRPTTYAVKVHEFQTLFPPCIHAWYSWGHFHHFLERKRSIPYFCRPIKEKINFPTKWGWHHIIIF